jgi:hypothetical protein
MSLSNNNKFGAGDLNKILAQTAMEIHRTHAPEPEIESDDPIELSEKTEGVDEMYGNPHSNGKKMKKKKKVMESEEITEEEAIADLTEWLDGIVSDVEAQLERELSEEELDYTLDHAISLLETEEEIESAE